jgi:hypothetical protein
VIPNPWKMKKAFERACKKIDKLEERVADLEKIQKSSDAIIQAQDERAKAIADYARARNFGIDHELAEFGL